METLGTSRGTPVEKHCSKVISVVSSPLKKLVLPRHHYEMQHSPTGLLYSLPQSGCFGVEGSKGLISRQILECQPALPNIILNLQLDVRGDLELTSTDLATSVFTKYQGQLSYCSWNNMKLFSSVLFQIKVKC